MFLDVFTSHVIMMVMAPYLSTKTLFRLLGTCRAIRRGWYFDSYMWKSDTFEEKVGILKKARQWRAILQWQDRCKKEFNLNYNPSRQDISMFLHSKVGKSGVVTHTRYGVKKCHAPKKRKTCPACLLDLCSEH
jgi:hypothetical protein